MGLRCKRCGSEEHVKNGFMKGLQRYRCKACGLSFTHTPPRGMPLRMYEGQKSGRTFGLQAGWPCESRGNAGSGDHQETDADLHARGFAPRTSASLNPLRL